MTQPTDLRDALIEVLKGELDAPHRGTVEGIENAADAILSLLARWECKEPGDCPE